MEGGQAGGGSDGVEGEGDQDESSSSSSKIIENRILANFRREWQKEIADSEKDKNPGQNLTKKIEPTLEYNVEDKAKVFFQLGVENEERGHLYEAVQFYKKAFQLVPDIEIRIAQQATSHSELIREETDLVDRDKEELYDEDEKCDDDSEDEEFDPDKIDLLTHLAGIVLRSKNRNVCTPLHPTNSVRHLSELPMEVILYILRWVVGSELDLRSLEQVGMVCRGLYLCARDAELWRLACTRTWGVRCGPMGIYQSWRDMYIFRSRVQTGGCYISKTTYIRPGENSFQDQFYRPWHLVQYFRYLRFFSDGTCLMMTSSEEPVTCVGLLKRKQIAIASQSVGSTGTPTKGPISPVYTGYYRLLDSNIVSIIVSPSQQQMKQAGIGRSNRQPNNANRQTFHIELEIVTMRNRLHSKLVWRRYSLFSRHNNGSETNTNFELIANRFPPFWFSRVKSYTSDSTSPL